jgi:hypothetical protein
MSTGEQAAGWPGVGLRDLPDSTVLDGELVAIGGLKPVGAAPRSGARPYLPGYARCEQCTSGAPKIREEVERSSSSGPDVHYIQAVRGG